MARAVQEIWPDVKVTIGPVRDNGWFYDFDRAEPFTPEDLGQIEAKMKQIINARDPVRTEVWDRARAIAYYEAGRALQDRTDRPRSPKARTCACTGTGTGRTCAAARICSTPGRCLRMPSS
jgi:hypothetical protein